MEEAVVFVSSFLKFLLKRVLGKMSIKEASFIPFRKKRMRNMDSFSFFKLPRKVKSIYSNFFSLIGILKALTSGKFLVL